jgi:NADH-quinone oxidoreductase subunit H
MDFGWKILIPVALGWFLLLAALREFSPDGEFGDSVRVVLFSFAVAVVAAGLFGLALRTSARNRDTNAMPEPVSVPSASKGAS